MLLALGLIIPAAPVFSDANCATPSAKLLIVGTYHMDNPGLDAINVHADDVLSERRQREIEELVDKLARFRPTKIAVEGAASDKKFWQTRYEKYVSGEHTLTRNEIEQIGFRLAKKLGHAAIYPIDYQMMMSGLRYDEIDFSRRKPPSAPAPSASPSEPRQLTEAELLLRRRTVLENLREANDPARAAQGHSGYFGNLLPTDDPAIYAGADLVANWYKRNLRMLANLAAITDFERDRVLLIVGSGHLHILRDFAIHAPYFCVEDTNAFLK
jgi:hypothetical protein